MLGYHMERDVIIITTRSVMLHYHMMLLPWCYYVMLLPHGVMLCYHMERNVMLPHGTWCYVTSWSDVMSPSGTWCYATSWSDVMLPHGVMLCYHTDFRYTSATSREELLCLFSPFLFFDSVISQGDNFPLFCCLLGLISLTLPNIFVSHAVSSETGTTMIHASVTDP